MKAGKCRLLCRILSWRLHTVPLRREGVVTTSLGALSTMFLVDSAADGQVLQQIVSKTLSTRERAALRTLTIPSSLTLDAAAATPPGSLAARVSFDNDWVRTAVFDQGHLQSVVR